MDLFTPMHLIVLAAVALLVFGPRRLPELGAGLGKTLREFRSAVNGIMDTPPPVVPPVVVPREEPPAAEPTQRIG